MLAGLAAYVHFACLTIADMLPEPTDAAMLYKC
jgi:hypothetical protein